MSIFYTSIFPCSIELLINCGNLIIPQSLPPTGTFLWHNHAGLEPSWMVPSTLAISSTSDRICQTARVCSFWFDTFSTKLENFSLLERLHREPPKGAKHKCLHECRERHFLLLDTLKCGTSYLVSSNFSRDFDWVI